MIISIEYNEPNPASYTSVTLAYSLEKIKVFNTTDFCKDWFNAVKTFIFESDNTDVKFSSSVDNFFIDGADELYDVINVPNTSIPIYIPKRSKMKWNDCLKLWN